MDPCSTQSLAQSATGQVENTSSEFALRASVSVDLRLLDYVNQCDRNLTCPICHCPFVDGEQLSCDHTFCRQCISQTLSNQDDGFHLCPTCRNPINARRTIPRFVRHLLDDLLVYCPHRDAGCTEQLRRGDVQVHVNLYCPWTMVPCPSPECDLHIPRLHASQGCLHLRLNCEHCEKPVARYQLEDHLRTQCSIRRWDCAGCGQSHPASEFARHEANCAQVTKKCNGSLFGCSFSAQRGEIAEHERQCSIALLRPYLQDLITTIENQKHAAQLSRMRVQNMESKMALLDDYVAKNDSSSCAHPGIITEEIPGSALFNVVDEPPFDSATHHLLLMHESLRDELDRIAEAVTQSEARTMRSIMTENVRLKEDMAHLSGAVNTLRMQVQWLMSARLHAYGRLNAHSIPSTSPAAAKEVGTPSVDLPSPPTRRLSDSSTKL